MVLQQVSVRGRRFVVQFYEVMREFGREIPWLDGLDDLRYAMNGEWFCDELARRTRQGSSTVTPYQFVDSDSARTFVGGILHFAKSPERFCDGRNIEIAERLASEQANFMSCLQIRPERRQHDVGREMMLRSVAAIRAKHGAVWGVTSNPRLRAWYESLGAQSLSPRENDDNLWILSWPAT